MRSERAYSKVVLALFLAAFVAVTAVVTGCCDDDTPTTETKKTALDLTVQINGLSAAEKQSIDRVEIVSSGADPLKISEDSSVFMNGAFVESAEVETPKEASEIYVRVSVYAGDFEVAGQTQLLQIPAKADSVEATFNLTSPEAKNGCILTQSPQAIGLPEGTSPHSFDVVADAGTGYLAVYGDAAGGRKSLHSVKLDARGHAVAAPHDFYSLTDGVATNPSLSRNGNFYVLANQSTFATDGGGTASMLQLTTLDSDGVQYGGNLVVDGQKIEMLPVVTTAIGAPVVAVSWNTRLQGDFSDELKISRPGFNADGTFKGLTDGSYSRVAPANTSSKHFTSISTPGGYAAVWSEKTGSTYKLKFLKLSTAMTPVLESTVVTTSIEPLHPSLVDWGTAIFVTWEEARSGKMQIYGAVVNLVGGIAGENLYSQDTRSEAKNSRVTYKYVNMGTGIMFTQLRDKNEGADAQLFLRRIAPNGLISSVPDLQISHALDASIQNPRVVALTDGFLIFWLEVKEGAASQLMAAKATCQ